MKVFIILIMIAPLIWGQIDSCVQNLTIDETYSLEAKSELEKENKTPYMLILKGKGKPDVEMARWIRDDTFFKQRGWETPADGLFNGLAISSALCKEDFVAALVVYRRKLYVAAGSLSGKFKCTPALVKDINLEVKPLPAFENLSKEKDSIVVTLKGGGKIQLVVEPTK